MKKSQQKTLHLKLSNTEVVVLAVYRLTQGTKVADTEDVAIEANRIAPGRFCWRKYRDQIQLELVRIRLSGAKNEKNGHLLQGSGRTGWSLTRKGLDWVKNLPPELAKADHSKRREEKRSESVDENRWNRERARIVGSQSWLDWAQDGRHSTDSEARKIFRIDSYADSRIATLKIQRLLTLFADDKDLLAFLKQAEAALVRNGEV